LLYLVERLHKKILPFQLKDKRGIFQLILPCGGV
jgi:hypothetical protein